MLHHGYTRALGSEALDVSRESALVARGLVLVNDLLVGDAVDHRYRLLEDALRGSLVARHDGLLHALDGGAQSGAQAGVVGALLDGLASTLARLCAIGHGCFSL